MLFQFYEGLGVGHRAMGAFAFVGKSEGLEIRPVIGRFQSFRQTRRKAETTVVMRLSQHENQIVVSIRQALQAVLDKGCSNTLLLEGGCDSQWSQDCRFDGGCLVQD